MRVTWYGTASLMLVSEDGTERIAVDPFLGMPEKEELVPLFRTAGRVLVTHGHFDHILHVPELYGPGAGDPTTTTPIYCTLTPARTLEKRGIPAARLFVVDGGETYRWGPLTTRTFPSRHCQFDKPLVRRTVRRLLTCRQPARALRLATYGTACPENGEMMFYEIEEDGTRLQIMGSLGLRDDVAYPTGADVLIMAFQGRSDIEDYAAPLAARLRPKSIWLYHYDDAFPPLSQDVPTKPFASRIEENLGIPCRPMRFGEEARV